MEKVIELRKKLLVMFEGLENGTVDRKDAQELNNTAGKIINTVKIQLEYSKLRKDVPSIDFLAVAKRQSRKQ